MSENVDVVIRSVGMDDFLLAVSPTQTAHDLYMQVFEKHPSGPFNSPFSLIFQGRALEDSKVQTVEDVAKQCVNPIGVSPRVTLHLKTYTSDDYQRMADYYQQYYQEYYANMYSRSPSTPSHVQRRSGEEQEVPHVRERRGNREEEIPHQGGSFLTKLWSWIKMGIRISLVGYLIMHDGKLFSWKGVLVLLVSLYFVLTNVLKRRNEGTDHDRNENPDNRSSPTVFLLIYHFFYSLLPGWHLRPEEIYRAEREQHAHNE